MFNYLVQFLYLFFSCDSLFTLKDHVYLLGILKTENNCTSFNCFKEIFLKLIWADIHYG